MMGLREVGGCLHRYKIFDFDNDRNMSQVGSESRKNDVDKRWTWVFLRAKAQKNVVIG